MATETDVTLNPGSGGSTVRAVTPSGQSSVQQVTSDGDPLTGTLRQVNMAGEAWVEDPAGREILSQILTELGNIRLVLETAFNVSLDTDMSDLS